MRTFIAIPLPDECRSLLEKMQNELRPCGAEVGWVAVPSIHLTLKFLGELDPNAIPALARKLEEAASSTHSFELRLHGLGCFPHERSPRVVWCGIEGDTDTLLQLQQKVESACAQLGFPPEDRAFKPHLTLGRIKGKRNLQPLVDCIKMGSAPAHSFKVQHFHIYKSTLRPQGALYSVLNTIALRD